MKSANTAQQSPITSMFAAGNEVFITTDRPLPDFQKDVLAQYGPRKTARQNPQKATARVLIDLARQHLNLPRKHLTIHTLVPQANGTYKDCVSS